MAEDGGKEVGGGKVGEAELLGEAGGGVGEQMAAEGLTHALGGVRSGIVAQYFAPAPIFVICYPTENYSP